MLRRVSLIVAIAFVSSRANAQNSTAVATVRRAVLTGVAIDSINGGYLAGASIRISGTDLSTTSDSLGLFRIAGIPAGTHVVEIKHPLLDSLAVNITTRPRTFNDGDSSFVMVGIPSAATIAASTCSEEDRLKGPAFIAGTVTDAESGLPATGSSVVVEWMDYDIGKKSIKVSPQRRVIPVSQTGRFRACGLPADLVAAVVAYRGRDSTATLRTNLSSLIGILSFRLPAPRDSLASPSSAGARLMGSAVLIGRVIDAEGQPAKGASVGIEDDGVATVTASDGTFTLSGLRAGTRSLAIHKIGYEAAHRPVELRRGGVTKAELTLGRSVTLLKEMVVNAKRGAGLQFVGFTHRKTNERGTFLGPEQVEHDDPHRIASVLRTVPVLKRGGCVIYYVDGFRVVPGIDPQDYLGGAEVGAVEAYSALFVPGEFPAFTDTGIPCNAVIIWTKEKLRLR